ncbi:MAG: hypothetical protein ACTSPY_08310 [Candidatus Helarchaeota archaeon]
MKLYFYLNIITNEFPMIPGLYGDERPRKTITELKCPKCESIQIRDFKVGDYIFKKIEDEICKKCKHHGLLINSVHDIVDPNKAK